MASPQAQDFLNSIQSDLRRFWPAIAAVFLVLGIRRLFTVPAELAHLPRVPVLPTLWSYAKGEVEDVRIKKLILPFANEKGEGVVVIYALGRWIVHVLDRKVSIYYSIQELLLTGVAINRLPRICPMISSSSPKKSPQMACYSGASLGTRTSSCPMAKLGNVTRASSGPLSTVMCH